MIYKLEILTNTDCYIKDIRKDLKELRIPAKVTTVTSFGISRSYQIRFNNQHDMNLFKASTKITPINFIAIPLETLRIHEKLEAV